MFLPKMTKHFQRFLLVPKWGNKIVLTLHLQRSQQLEIFSTESKAGRMSKPYQDSKLSKRLWLNM